MQQPQYTCPRCGAPIQAGQAACTNCGLALDPQSLAAWQAATRPPPVYGGPAPPPSAPPRTGPPRWLTPVLVGVVLLCAACGVIGVLATGSQNQAARDDAARATLTAIAQQLAVPPTAPPMGDTPTPPAGPTATLRPDEADIQILDFSDYADSQGNSVVIGQVQNTGHGLAYEIQVTGEGQDATGARVASGSDLLLALAGLPAGAKAPFQIRLGKPTAEVSKLHVQGSFKTFNPDAVHVFVPAGGLGIAGQQLAPAAAGKPAQVSGQVTNGGSKGATQVRVLVSGYDAQGKLVAVEQGPAAPDTIPAGGTATFTIPFASRPDVVVAKVDVLPIGNEAP